MLLRTLYISHHHLVYIAGGRTSWGSILDDVLQFDAEEGQWTKIGSMKISRYAHAVSVINYNSVREYCK